MSAFRIPVGVTHLVFFFKVFLGSPSFIRAVGVLLCWEWSLIFWDVNLIFSHQVVNSGVLLIFKPGVRHSKIVIWMYTHWQFSWNWIPRVFVHFPNWSISKNHLSHLIICSWRPKDFCLLSLWISYDLATNISLICFIENINTEVNDKVSEINFFVWLETKLLNSKGFTSCQAWNASHHFFNIRALHCVVPRGFHLSVKLLDVFHCPRSIVSRNRSWLSNRVDVSHVVNSRGWVAMEGLQIRIEVIGAEKKLVYKLLTLAALLANCSFYNWVGCKDHGRIVFIESTQSYLAMLVQFFLQQ